VCISPISKPSEKAPGYIQVRQNFAIKQRADFEKRSEYMPLQMETNRASSLPPQSAQKDLLQPIISGSMTIQNMRKSQDNKSEEDRNNQIQ